MAAELVGANVVAAEEGAVGAVAGTADAVVGAVEGTAVGAVEEVVWVAAVAEEMEEGLRCRSEGLHRRWRSDN